MSVSIATSEENAQLNECPICYVEIGEKNNCVTECGHAFCLKCIVTYMSSHVESPCPICRTPMGEHKQNNMVDDNDDEQDDDEDDEDESYDEGMDEEEYDPSNAYLFPMHYSTYHMDNFMGLCRDATSRSYHDRHVKYTDDYCVNKFRIRRGVFDALCELKDNEWKLAEYDILKSISKYYGKTENPVWEEDESLGLANDALFTS
jgi:hypothetical protein